jgi:uncharacterized Zn finger protein (UPF0148 family)
VRFEAALVHEEEQGLYEDEDEVDEPQSLEEMKREYDARNKARDVISKKLGDKMMVGWTLLGDSCAKPECSGTPLVSSPKEPGRLFCVSCAQSYTKSSTTGTVEPAPAPAPAPALTATPKASVTPSGLVSDAPILDFSRPREQDSSSRIADKLLKGWAMLNEMCAQSGCDGAVPLMRDATGAKHCVDCGFCSSSSAVAGAGAGSGAKGQAVASRRDRAGVDLGEVQDEDEDEEEEDREDSEAFAAYAAARLAPAPAPALPRPANDTNSASAPPSGEVGAALTACRAKLSQAAARLQRAEDVHEATDLAVLIDKLAVAAKSLSSLQSL